MVEDIEKVRQQILTQLEKMPTEQVAGLRQQILNATPEELEQFLRKMNKPAGGCIFCKIAKGEVSTVKIYESAEILAILDINPISAGHILILPKKHFQFIFQIPDEILTELFYFIKQLSPILINSTKAEGLSIIAHQGVEQNVPHFVINLIPRFSNEKIGFEQERQKKSKEELENLAGEIRTKIERQEIEKAAREEKEKQAKTKQQGQEEKEIRQFGRRIPH